MFKVYHVFLPWPLDGIPNFKLVGGIPTPLENMSSSVGVTIPNICKNKNVPNHQNMQLDLTSTMNGLMGISSRDGQTKHMVYKDK